MADRLEAPENHVEHRADGDRRYAVEDLLERFPDRYPEAVQPVLAHLQHVLCGGDDDRYAFAIQWTAHVLQDPQGKFGAALVLPGGHDLELWVELLARIVGRRRVSFTPAPHESDLLTIVDLPTVVDRRHDVCPPCELRRLVTAPTVRVERKAAAVRSVASVLVVDGQVPPVDRARTASFARAVDDPRAQVEFFRRMREVERRERPGRDPPQAAPGASG